MLGLIVPGFRLSELIVTLILKIKKNKNRALDELAGLFASEGCSAQLWGPDFHLTNEAATARDRGQVTVFQEHFGKD